MSRERPRIPALPPAKENIDRLEKAVKDGNHYGAQQMYKFIAARYIAAERSSVLQVTLIPVEGRKYGSSPPRRRSFLPNG